MSFVKKSTFLIALTRFWNNTERYIESSVPKLWIWMEYQSCEGACHSNVCLIPRATYHTKYLVPLICNLQVVVASVREKNQLDQKWRILKEYVFFCCCFLSNLSNVISVHATGYGLFSALAWWRISFPFPNSRTPGYHHLQNSLKIARAFRWGQFEKNFQYQVV